LTRLALKLQAGSDKIAHAARERAAGKDKAVKKMQFSTASGGLSRASDGTLEDSY